MKTKNVRLDAGIVRSVAEKLGMSPEEYVAMTYSISSGRRVCAHLDNPDETDGEYVFTIS